MRILTLKQLRGHGACEEARRLFKQAFGESTPITVELAVQHAERFGAYWGLAADVLLTPTAWAEYNRVRATAWTEYDRVSTAVETEYDRARAAALAEYNRAKAAGFATLYNQDEQ